MSKSFLNIAGLPLGLRNNNPGNIRPGDPWQGMIGTNEGFVVFQNIAYGIRAMATDIGNDIRLKGLNTLTKLITEYAPPSENDTQSYINSMVGYTGFGPNQVLPETDATLRKLIRGHIIVELGAKYSPLVTDADIQEGIAMMNSQLLDFFNISPGSVGAWLLYAAAAALLHSYRHKLFNL
jgi:hypothetical protein